MAGCLCFFVVDGMIDVLVTLCHHFSTMVGVVFKTVVGDAPRRIKPKHMNRGVPIIDNQHVFASFVNGDVTRGCTFGVGNGFLFQRAVFRIVTVRYNGTVFHHTLRARVHDITVWVQT